MPRILLVEDNEVNREMLRKRLERRGFAVVVAGSAEEGLILAAVEPPDAVLMDLGLPGMDGWEATRRLKADPRTAAVPVIVVSAHVTAEAREKALAAGCDDFEGKPVQLDTLIGKVNAALVRRGVPAAPPPAVPPPSQAPAVGVPPPVPPPPAPPPIAARSLSDTMIVPLAQTTRVPAPTPAPPAPVPADEAVPVGRKRILVVEDNDPNRVMLCRRLVKHGYETAEARDGREGLALAHASRFDLMLCDIMMPEMDGYQVLQALKADPDMQALPVIMISAVDEMASVVRCIEMGAEDYLTKPYDPVLLHARINACLDKRRMRDQEMAYLRAVADLTQAAAMVETGDFDPALLKPVAARDDALGRLARVFEKMAREVQARVRQLTQEVQRLKVEIDESRKAEQVTEITESLYFQQLQQKASQLRRRSRRGDGDAAAASGLPPSALTPVARPPAPDPAQTPPPPKP